jgi:HPr kinase/phosphorylase
VKRQHLTVGRLLETMQETLELEYLGEPEQLTREITSSEAASPGLVLSGYTDRFVPDRTQVLGETEISYLWSLSAAQRGKLMGKYLEFPIPCIIVTKGQELPEELEQGAREAGIPLMRSPLKTSELYRRLKPFLEEEFAATTTLHGSLADVYGVGLLFVGQSGIGKSECVLDLVERGHRLVADDLVIASRRGTDIIIGRGHELQRHHMEIRGVGVIDVPAIFGVRAVRQQKRIEVVVQLQEWDRASQIDRTGLDTQNTNILGVDVPKVTVPLNPGKNITVVAEVVAMNHLLRYAGIDVAEVFNERLIGRMRTASQVRQYLREDNE